MNSAERELKIELLDTSETTVVAFSGIGILGPQPVPPVFEFQSILVEFPVTKIFVRDLKQAWYLGGVAQLGSSLSESVERLGEILAEIAPKKLVMIGNSSGAYAALVFGAMLRADVVYAFSPRTFFGPLRRFLFRDNRFCPEVRRAETLLKEQERYFMDVKKILLQASPDTTFHIHYPLRHRIDAMYARHLKSIKQVKLHGHDLDTHDIILSLKESGQLRKLLEAGIGG